MKPLAMPSHGRGSLRRLKTTYLRDLLLNFFASARTRHWSAEDIYRVLIADGQPHGINAVKRALAELEQAGLLARHKLGPNWSVFELADRPPHDHLVCTRCGHVEEFHDPDIAARRVQVAAQHGFELRHHALVLRGRCARAECRTECRADRIERE